MGGRTHSKFFHDLSKEPTGECGETGTGISKLSGVTSWYEQLTPREALSWGFDVPPSRLETVCWANTHEDIKITLKLKLSSKYLQSVQYYEAMSLVLSQAFGGEKSEGKGEPKDFKEAEAAIANIIGKNNGN